MLTEKRYEVIWRAFVGGASDEVLIDFGISEGTLGRVKRSKGNYQEYKKLHGEEVLSNNKKIRKDKNDTQVVRHEQTVTIVANHYMAEEMQKQTKLLETISKKLAAIIDDLTGVKTPENEK